MHLPDEHEIEKLHLASNLLVGQLQALSHHYNLCAVCLINAVNDAVNRAVESGDIAHGVPGIEDFHGIEGSVH